MNSMVHPDVLTYQLESWAEFWRDGEALRLAHWEEICQDKDRMRMKLNPDEYWLMWMNNMLQVLTARDDRKMVGYVMTVIRPHTHYNDVLCGFEDAHFLLPEYRRGMAGVRLIREAEDHLKAAGVKRVFFHTKANANKGPVFERLGYAMSDVIYSKWIGE